MDLIDLEQAHELLRPRIPAFMGALTETSERWNNHYDTRPFDSSSRATIWHREIVFRTASALSADPGVEFRNRQNQKYFLLEGRIAVRVKQLRTGLLTSNYPTRTARMWELQQSLPGMEPGARLNFGYRLNEIGTQVEDAFVTLPIGDTQAWVIQLDGEPVENDLRIQLPHESASAYDRLVYTYDEGWKTNYGNG